MTSRYLASWCRFFAGTMRGWCKKWEVLVTPDRNLEHQQNLSRAGLAVVVVRARTNRIEDITPLVPRILEVLLTARPSMVIRVGV